MLGKLLNENCGQDVGPTICPNGPAGGILDV